MYYTTIGKKITCTHLKIDITLSGKYIIPDDETSKIMRFQSAKCPIYENSKKPVYEQSEEYKWLRCPLNGNCPLLHDFPETAEIK